MTRKRVVVEFFDITIRSDGWFDQEEVDNTLPILLVAEGLIVYEDEHLLKLAPMYNAERQCAGVLMIIPKGCIFTRRDI